MDGRIDDFSLVLGGPLYQLMVRSGLIRPPLSKVGWRITVITGIVWLPLLVVSGLSGRLLGGVPVPFERDLEVQTRLLVALPLMILAESVVHTRMRAIAQQFVERRIVTQVAPAFEQVVASAMRLRNSVFVEVALLVVVFLGGRMVWREASVFQSDSWFASLTASGMRHTWAGYWYVFVSLPIFQFILLRWYFRLFLWGRFLFQVSRLDLNLVPLHPDRCCGLGFLGNVASAFAPLLMAHSALIAGFVANRILLNGAALPNYRFEIGGMGLILLAIVLGPLCVFVPKLNSARFAGLRTYGPLASDYVIAFAEKWSHGARGSLEPLLGSADIQSLADLDNSYGIVQDVKLVPFGRQTIIRLLVFIVLPLAPLLLTMFSLDELLKRLLSIVL